MDGVTTNATGEQIETNGTTNRWTNVVREEPMRPQNTVTNQVITYHVGASDTTQNPVANEVTTYQHFDASNRLIESGQPDGSVTTHAYNAAQPQPPEVDESIRMGNRH